MRPVAVWKDLCLDALDRRVVGEFWAAALGLELVVSSSNVSLDGPTPAHRVWVNQVDRAHLVKNRVHLDLDVASVDDLVALGGRVLAPAEETGLGWTVMADPEGNELCAFVRDPADLPSYRLHGIGVDCVDPEALARWWGGVLGAEATQQPGDDWWTLTGVAADERMTLDFAPVPEPRTVPNRVHWDLWGDVDDLLAAGATRLWQVGDLTAMADPEGHEFCVQPR